MKQRIRQGIAYAFCMAAVAAVFGTAFNALRPGGIPFVGDRSPKAVTGTHARDLELIGADKAFDLFMRGEVLFIDAREPSGYAGGHIPGSTNIPPEAAEEHISEVRSMLETGKTLIAYCYDAGCPSAADLVRRLERLGAGPVKIMPEGWAGWMERGYPYE